MKDKKMLIGFNTFEGKVLDDRADFRMTADGGRGVDFVVCHEDTVNRGVEKTVEDNKKISEILAARGIKYISNHEDINFDSDCKSEDGYDWAEGNGDGTHRLRFPEEYKKTLKEDNNCLGVMYDEMEHVIINRNISVYMSTKFKRDIPAFVTTGNKDVVEQGELLSSQLGAYADEMTLGRSKLFMGEHVYPVLFHTFARNGITPNFKSQKESISNVQYMIAAGAALQYGTPLFNCVDNWYRMTNPGHSAEEMYYNLVFAYFAGVNSVYVESDSVFTEKGKDGVDRLTSHGKYFTRFSEEYRGKDRDYDISDYTPEIGIIRYDDTFWGQGHTKHFWRNMLFGNPKIKVGKEAKEYIKAINIITHGATGNSSISWGAIEPHSLTSHHSFAPMNNAVVFDDRVTKDKLSTLKLCFLCGYHISKETLNAVKELVKENGLTVVTSERFAPLYVSMKHRKGMTEVKDGKGSWIVVDDFAAPALKRRLESFVGKKDEITLRFGEKTVKLKLSKDMDGFEVI